MIDHGAPHGRGMPHLRYTAPLNPTSPPSDTYGQGLCPHGHLRTLTRNSGSFCCLDTSEDISIGD